MISFNSKDNHIGSAVYKILWYTQGDILLFSIYLPRYTSEEMLRVDLEELTELDNDEYENYDDDTNYEPNDEEENELDEDEGKSVANLFTDLQKRSFSTIKVGPDVRNG